MNPDNHGTPKASKRLVDAGIVLEFEYCWFPDVNSKTGWSLNRCFGKLPSSDCIPATSMAEVYRLLPLDLTICRRTHPDVDSIINEVIKHLDIHP